MTTKIKGLDKFSRKLEKLSKNAKDLSKNNQYQLNEVFTKSFMTKNTNFTDIESFLLASPERISTQEEFTAADETILDSFVYQQTNFKTWKEMLNKASEELIARRLGL